MSDTVTETVEAFARGEIVIVTDDDERENEGDLIVAASLCTPEKMAFIIRHTCGIVCAPLTLEEARRLRLDPMVASNDAPLGTAFTVSVDVRHGLTTGISAEQRSNTVRALANNNMGAADFVRPGHVFPLIAKDGGVLMRSGHTEAAGLRDRERRADDAAGIADDEGHLLRRAEGSGDDEVALVLAIVVIRDDDDFTAGESLDGFVYGMGHQGLLGGLGKKIIGRDSPPGFTGDQFGGVPGEPSLIVIAQLGDGARGDADPPRECDA